MAKEWITPMPWNNEGVAPSENLQDRGFQKGDGLPATIFNHAFYKTNQSITELQTEVGKMIPTYYASWEESPTMLIDYAIYTEEEIPSDLEKYILMFHGWGGTTNDPVVTINDESYSIVGMDGNPLPEGAWTTGSLVTLNVDTVSKKAFFKLGSASLDLSFVTAGAENIQEGFVGADAEGNPIHGSLMPSKVVAITGETLWVVSGTSAKPGATFIMPDFDPDFVYLYWHKHPASKSTGADTTHGKSQIIWWDKTRNVALDCHSSSNALQDYECTYYNLANSSNDFSSFPYDFTANSTITLMATSGYSTLSYVEGSGYAILYAFKF